MPATIRPVLPLLLALTASAATAAQPEAGAAPVYQVRPIGWVRKADGRTTIEIDATYRAALLGVEDLDEIWVLYWFDRNDTPARRAIQQVHPRGDPASPLRGVFATRAPVRPNLIGLTRCRVHAVQGTVIVIEEIDAFPDTPVLDIKPVTGNTPGSTEKAPRPVIDITGGSRTSAAVQTPISRDCNTSYSGRPVDLGRGGEATVPAISWAGAAFALPTVPPDW